MMTSSGKCRNEAWPKENFTQVTTEWTRWTTQTKKGFCSHVRKEKKKLCSFRKADVHMLLTCCCWFRGKKKAKGETASFPATKQTTWAGFCTARRDQTVPIISPGHHQSQVGYNSLQPQVSNGSTPPQPTWAPLWRATADAWRTRHAHGPVRHRQVSSGTDRFMGPGISIIIVLSGAGLIMVMMWGV